MGLAAAYEAAKNGNKVLLIEKRSEEQAAVRPQVAVLDPARKQQLMQMIGPEDRLDLDDIKFLDALAQSAEIKLRDVQKFILNRIKNLNKQCIQNAHEPIIDLSYGTQLSAVDLKNGSGEIKVGEEKKPIQFEHLVAADGASSETLELVNANLEKSGEKPLQRKTPRDMKHLEETFLNV